VTVLRSAYVKVKPDTDGFDTELKSKLRRIDASKDGNRVGRTFGDGLSKGFTGGTFTRVAATMAARIAVVGTAAAAAAPGVIHLTAALVPAAGAAVALPSALLAGKAALATFKVATAGVSDAIKKGFTGTAKEAAKAMEGLPPAAQRFGRSVIALKPQLDALRASVSQRFFAPLQNEITPLANRYLPLLRSQMSQLSAGMGTFAESVAHSARSALVMDAVTSIFENTTVSVNILRGAVRPLITAFATLIQGTAPFLPGIARGLRDIAASISSYITQAVQSGEVTQIWRNAQATLRDLGGIALNVASILGSVFRAAAQGSGSLLGNLRSLTGQVAAFLRSAQGTTALTSVFSTLGQLGQALRTSLGAVLPAIAQSVRALAPAVSGLAPAFAQLVVAIAPLLPYVSQIAAAVLRAFIPAISGVAGWLAQNTTVLKVLVASLGAAITVVKVIAAVTKVWAAAQAILNLALTANPVGIVVVALAALAAGLVAAYRNSETFRAFVDKLGRSIQTAWGQMKTIIGAVSSWFTGTIIPSIQRAIQQANTAWNFMRNLVTAVWNGIKTAITVYWNAIRAVFVTIRSWLTILGTAFRGAQQVIGIAMRTVGAGIRAVWDSIRTGSFTPLRNFITQTLPNAFRAGVTAIRAAWSRIQEAARTPVAFVVNHVINPLIGGYNRIAGVFHAPQASKIGGFERGGQIPGMPSLRDNMLAAGPAGPLAVASGEFITNTRSTMANLPLLQAINRKRGRVSRDDVDPFLDGAATGGLATRRGVGDGLGDFFSKIWRSVKGVATSVGNAVLHPLETLKKVAGSLLGRIPGAGTFVSTLRGMGTNVINAIGNWLKNNAAGGGLGNQNVYGGWRGMQRLIAGRFPNLHMISGFRPGARTLTGNTSYHALGRAVDYPPVRALAAWIKATFGAHTKELITPWQELNLHNGRPHHYTGAVWNQHNFAGGNAHVHWAAALGGLVGKKSGIPIFDTGGVLAPGFNTVYNATGKSERVVPARGGGDIHVHLHNAVITSKRQAVDMVVEAVTTAKKERRL
jgi:phage-related protein